MLDPDPYQINTYPKPWIFWKQVQVGTVPVYTISYLQQEEERVRRLRRLSAPLVRLRNEIMINVPNLHTEQQLEYTVYCTFSEQMFGIKISIYKGF